MADNKLAKFGVSESGIERLAPEVKTLARPQGGPLLAARHEVKRNPKLQQLFQRARKDKQPPAVLAEAVAAELSTHIEGSEAEIRQVALYLADEYEQIGDALLLISSATGKAIARISEQDIWQPPNVPREGGGMAKPLPRLRPDLEGFLVQWVFDEEREQRAILQRSETLPPQTELQRIEGDRRLLPLTKAGRGQVAQGLQEALPTLLGAVQGLGRLFLTHFDVQDIPLDVLHLEPVVKCSALSRTMQRIPDLKTLNLRYDALTSAGAQVANGWVRDMAYTLAKAAEGKVSPRKQVRWPEGDIPREVTLADFWVGNPDFAKATANHVPCLPVEGTSPIGLRGKVGAIVIDPTSYDSRSREVFDRWEMAAVVEYNLYVDWSKIIAFEFEGIPMPVAVAEIVA